MAAIVTGDEDDPFIDHQAKLTLKLPSCSVHNKLVNISSSEDEQQGSGDSGSEGDESEGDESEGDESEGDESKGDKEEKDTNPVSDTSDIEFEDRFSDALVVTPKSQRIKTFEDVEEWSPPSARTAYRFLVATPSGHHKQTRSSKSSSTQPKILFHST
ncbi:hypothetical protein BDP27DRAFT_1424183 [Rhodocollybia butyracea]|uniref:Uncharacterized protein n=1 Tax=Rhodocollybia butyracea TaxID=206335 RepID=A0A9P5U4W1_9AGAR|nr:hypothetical protein BDP27DRAFT_1424183 [Rhodocollybia butyracea]